MVVSFSRKPQTDTGTYFVTKYVFYLWMYAW